MSMTEIGVVKGDVSGMAGRLCFMLLLVATCSAWAYECAAGIIPLEPGFRKVAFRPHILDGVESLSVTYRTPLGEIRAGWKTVNGEPVFSYQVPEGIEVANEE